MTSGIPNYTKNEEFQKDWISDVYQYFSPYKLIYYVRNQQLNFQPGTQFEYSNTNAILLGIIVEIILNKPLYESLNEFVLEPMDLTNTYFENLYNSKIFPGFSNEFGELKETTNWNPSYAWCAGQMVSTANDVIKWSKIFGSGQLLNVETHEQQLENNLLGKNKVNHYYGYGLIYFDGWIMHNGSIPGYNSLMCYYPSHNISVVIFTNYSSPDINYLSALL